MSYDTNIINDLVDSYGNDWIKESVETLDSGVYNVYNGTGELSLVTIKINEEIEAEL